MAKRPDVFIQGVFLSLASFLIVVLAIVNFILLRDGIDAQMMAFESQPAPSRAYWRWFFIKRHGWGILASFGATALMGAIVLRGWVLWVKAWRKNVS